MIPDITMNEELYDLQASYNFRFMSMHRLMALFDTQYMWAREQIINEEDQYYLNPLLVAEEHNPFSFSSEGLSITAKQTPPELKDMAVDVLGNTQPYVSGVLTTRTKGESYHEGYIEIRCKLPEAAGAWPAFWSLPTFENWGNRPSVLPELDVLEALKTLEHLRRGVYSVNVHTYDSGKLQSLADRDFENDIETGADLINHMNTYGKSWSPDWIVFFFNGKQVLRVATPKDIQQEERHVILNLAVGGAASWREQPDSTHYPCSFVIEHVRFYKKAKKEEVALPVPTQVDRGDLLFILDDGREVRKSDLNLITEYFIQLNRQLPYVSNQGPKH
jgi:beta-glucanase (GH16 family)